MGFKVILTPRALDDLREIAAFIARDNPARAITLGDELTEKALQVGELPKANRAVPEVGDAAVREVIFQSYRIIYEIYSERRVVYILRFWHAARGEPKV